MRFTAIEGRFSSMDRRFDSLEERFHALQKAVIVGNFGLIASVLGVVLAQVLVGS